MTRKEKIPTQCDQSDLAKKIVGFFVFLFDNAIRSTVINLKLLNNTSRRYILGTKKKKSTTKKIFNKTKQKKKEIKIQCVCQEFC